MGPAQPPGLVLGARVDWCAGGPQKRWNSWGRMSACELCSMLAVLPAPSLRRELADSACQNLPRLPNPMPGISTMGTP